MTSIIGSNSDGVNDAVEGNVISGNALNGVNVVGSNTGQNRINGNSIFANGGLGIDLGNNGVTPNDPNDGDSGPNTLQNFPVITDARQGSTIIQFTFNSSTNSTFRIEFFSSTAPDPTAHGEGQTFLGSMNVTTNASGNFTGTFTTTTLAAGQVVSATATNSANNTSEFSNTRVVQTPTAVKFAEADAVRYQNGTVVEWRTGYETDYLGFNVYREVNGLRSLLTPQSVAGSALFATARTELTAANLIPVLIATPGQRHLLGGRHRSQRHAPAPWSNRAGAISGKRGERAPRRCSVTCAPATGSGITLREARLAWAEPVNTGQSHSSETDVSLEQASCLLD